MDFHTPEVFHDRLVLENHIDTTYLRKYIYKTAEIESKLNRLVNYTAYLSIAPDTVYKTLSRLGRYRY